MDNKIIDQLNWRYAVKAFDSSKEVSTEDVNGLLEVLRLSPSSFGLQPWKFVVVKNAEIRVKLKEHAWGQGQITDSSELIVLCKLKEMGGDYIQKYIEFIAKERNVEIATLDAYKKLIFSFFTNLSKEDLSHWMDKQVYLALGNLLTVCAMGEIDACPMEGFDPKKFDEILGLDKYGIESVVLCALGYRSGNDFLAKAKKVRFPKEEVFIEIL